VKQATITYLPYLLSAVTIWMTLLAGNMHRRAWLVGLVGQALWLVWIVATGRVGPAAAQWRALDRLRSQPLEVGRGRGQRRQCDRGHQRRMGRGLEGRRAVEARDRPGG
jgi:hypothetical protein